MWCITFDEMHYPAIFTKGKFFMTCCWLPKMKFCLLTLQTPELEIHVDEFANSVDLDEVDHNEPPHLDLHSLPSSL